MGVSKYKNGMIFPTKLCGDIKIIDYQDKYNIVVEFMDTGNTACITATALRIGHARDVTQPSLYGDGYIGNGVYNTREPDGKSKNRAYMYWNRMIRRCYHKDSKDYPMYGEKGVTVCEEWHNFQNFAKWFYSQKFYDNKGWHLDKDLTIIGNKIYCPKACNLVPENINLLAVKRDTLGVSWHNVANKWVTSINGKAVRDKDATYLIALYESSKIKYMCKILRDEFSKGNIPSKLLISVYNYIKDEYDTVTHDKVQKPYNEILKTMFTLRGGLLRGDNYE